MTVYQEDEKWLIKNEKAKIIPTKNLQYISRFINYNLAIGRDINGKFGLINRRGSTVLPFEYSNIYVNADASFTIFKNAFNGRVDESGHIIFPAVYTNLRPVIDQNGQFKKLYIGQINNKYFLLDDRNKLILPELKGNFSQIKQFFRNQKEVYLFSEIKPLEEGEEKSDNKDEEYITGVKDKNDKIIFPAQFSHISGFQNGFACATPKEPYLMRRNRYLIDVHGNMISVRDSQPLFSDCTDIEKFADTW